MRKIKIIEQISLDGVIQAPGGRDEDGDYAHGGWAMPYFDTDSRQHEAGVLGRAHERLSTRWIAANRIFRRRERLSGARSRHFFSEEAPAETADALAHFLTARPGQQQPALRRIEGCACRSRINRSPDVLNGGPGSQAEITTNTKPIK